VCVSVCTGCPLFLKFWPTAQPRHLAAADECQPQRVFPFTLGQKLLLCVTKQTIFEEQQQPLLNWERHLRNATRIAAFKKIGSIQAQGGFWKTRQFHKRKLSRPLTFLFMVTRTGGQLHQQVATVGEAEHIASSARVGESELRLKCSAHLVMLFTVQILRAPFACGCWLASGWRVHLQVQGPPREPGICFRHWVCCTLAVVCVRVVSSPHKKNRET
jgi:hypothetical protein